ncbi:MAG: hypothetical protein WBJ13_08485 [Sedimentibacter sp.]
MPDDIQIVLDESCFPGFKTLSIEEQNEILADVLSMGIGIRADEPANFTFMDMDFYYIETTAPGWGIGELPDELDGASITILPVN